MDKDKKKRKLMGTGKSNPIELIKKRKDSKKEALDKLKKELGMKAGGRAMRAGGGLMEATARLKRQGLKKGGGADTGTIGELKSKLGVLSNKNRRAIKRIDKRLNKRTKKMGGGMMRPMYGKGGGVCLRGMNREAVGKNS